MSKENRKQEGKQGGSKKKKRHYLTWREARLRADLLVAAVLIAACLLVRCVSDFRKDSAAAQQSLEEEVTEAETILQKEISAAASLYASGDGEEAPVSTEERKENASADGKSTAAEKPGDDASESGSELPDGVEEAELIKVVDGDTIWVRIDGEKKKLRMLQINAPESVHDDPSKNSRFGVEASDHLKELLDGTGTVYLTRDTSDEDQYGRLLRQVWFSAPQDPFDEAEIREKNVNARQILDGYARVVVYDDYSYEKLFRKFLKEAKAEGRGLWGDPEWEEYLAEQKN